MSACDARGRDAARGRRPRAAPSSSRSTEARRLGAARSRHAHARRAPTSAIGTIGGGHLELQAIDEARAMLRAGDARAALAALPARPGARPVLRRRGHARPRGARCAPRSSAWPEPRAALPAAALRRRPRRPRDRARARTARRARRLDRRARRRISRAAVRRRRRAVAAAHPPRLRRCGRRRGRARAARRVLPRAHAPPRPRPAHRRAILARGDFAFFGLIGSKTKRRALHPPVRGTRPRRRRRSRA